MEPTAETALKQQNSSASLTAENGGRRVARFNVTVPVGVTPSPAAAAAAVEDVAVTETTDRDQRDVSPSRFRVEFVSETAPSSCDDRHTIGSGSATVHYEKTFGHNTLETLPHADHYRNLLSATGHIRKRPTLLELHELSVSRSFLVINIGTVVTIIDRNLFVS